MRGDFATKGSDIASAATTDLGAVQGLFHDITGTVTITSFGTVGAGIWKVVKFEGALTLTHNGTSLILLGGANRTTVNGDVGIYVSEGSGNWREVAYSRVTYPPGAEFPSGTAVVFAQTAAPTGWTKSTTHNDKALRVVSGTASSGGATAFSSVFGAGKTTGSYTLTTSDIPAHAHATGTLDTTLTVVSGTIGGGANTGIVKDTANAGAPTSDATLSSISGSTATDGGSGGGHTHTESLDLQYVDVIIATKDAG